MHEFSELVTKTIKPVRANKGFITALMYYTGGNVYFCVALLVSFFDWLIQSDEDLEFTLNNLKDFMDTGVDSYLRSPRGSPDRFDFYRDYVKDALSLSPLATKLDDRLVWSSIACGATLALFQQEDNTTFEEAANLMTRYLNRDRSARTSFSKTSYFGMNKMSLHRS